MQTIAISGYSLWDLLKSCRPGYAGKPWYYEEAVIMHLLADGHSAIVKTDSGITMTVTRISLGSYFTMKEGRTINIRWRSSRHDSHPVQARLV